MAEIKYELAHIGINGANAEEALATAKFFASIFRLSINEGESSVYAGTAMEVMKSPYLGRLGHIGMSTPDCDLAVKDLESRGIAVDMSTAKYTPDGTLRVVYLKDEVAGFAVHIVKKP